MPHEAQAARLHLLLLELSECLRVLKRFVLSAPVSCNLRRGIHSGMVCLRIVSACACTVHSQLQPYSLQKLLQESHISAPVRPTLRGTVFNGAPSGMDGRSDWAAALSCVQAH